MDKQGLIEGKVRLDGLERQVQKRHRDGHHRIGKVFPISRSPKSSKLYRLEEAVVPLLMPTLF
jgi:hypothetical protein